MTAKDINSINLSANRDLNRNTDRDSIINKEREERPGCGFSSEFRYFDKWC